MAHQGSMIRSLHSQAVPGVVDMQSTVEAPPPPAPLTALREARHLQLRSMYICCSARVPMVVTKRGT
jgi:hypothetical protein